MTYPEFEKAEYGAYLDPSAYEDPCGAPDPESPWNDWWQEVARGRVGANFTILILGDKRFPELETPTRVLATLVAFAIRQNPDVNITLQICPTGGTLLLRLLASWSVVPLLETLDRAYGKLDVEIVEAPLDPPPDLVVHFPILAFQEQKIAKVAHDVKVAGIPVHAFGWDGFSTIGPMSGP
ncbi:MAG TPA: hypothetical protein V6D00_08410 [Pantanalinema sp.]